MRVRTGSRRPPRSACPGNQIAQAIMYIFGATVLSVFNIEKVTINGIVQEPRNEFSSGVLVYGSFDFRLRIKTDFFFRVFIGVPSHSRASSSHVPPRPSPSFGHSTFRITKSSMIRQRTACPYNETFPSYVTWGPLAGRRLVGRAGQV